MILGEHPDHAKKAKRLMDEVRHRVKQVADTLVDSNWAVEVLPGMNEWLKKVVEG